MVEERGRTTYRFFVRLRPPILERQRSRFSDVVMSGITGIETAIRARVILPSCKVLLFSGQAATANLLEKARAQGYEFEILIKPVHPSDLLARIRTAVPDDARSLTSK